MIFVTVGTTPFDFSRLLKKVDEIAGGREERVIVQKGHTKYEPSNCKSFDFVSRQRFLSYLKEARIVISHAGAGTTLLCLKYNKPQVIVPRLPKYGEHGDEHQIELAEQLERERNLTVIKDMSKLREAIDRVEAVENKGKNELSSYLREFLENLQKK